MSKVQGTVKWFDSRKGYGFVAPTSDNSPTAEEIFVHQTSIQSEGAYRTLVSYIEMRESALSVFGSCSDCVKLLLVPANMNVRGPFDAILCH
jgi:cold shock CspA family protein